jgi:hypothetical protein
MSFRPFLAVAVLFALTSCEHSTSSSAMDQPDEGIEPSLRRQIEQHWAFDPSLPGIETWSVVIAAEMGPDGSVKSASIVEDLALLKNDANYRKFADSALQAVMRSSPLKIPASMPYAAWRKIIMTFRSQPID